MPSLSFFFFAGVAAASVAVSSCIDFCVDIYLMAELFRSTELPLFKANAFSSLHVSLFPQLKKQKVYEDSEDTFFRSPFIVQFSTKALLDMNSITLVKSCFIQATSHLI